MCRGVPVRFASAPRAVLHSGYAVAWLPVVACSYRMLIAQTYRQVHIRGETTIAARIPALLARGQRRLPLRPRPAAHRLRLEADTPAQQAMPHIQFPGE